MDQLVVEPPAADRDLASRRSLALHAVVRQRLLVEPQEVRAIARRNLARLCSIHAGGRSSAWFEAWEALLAGPDDELAEALIDPGQRGVDLRQVTPFAGVVSPRERWAIWARIREEHGAT